MDDAEIAVLEQALDAGSSRTLSTRAYWWMLLGSFNFTIMGLIAHHIGDRCSWQIIAISRSALAFLIALTLCLVSGARLVVGGSFALWMRSIAGSLSLVGTFYALTKLQVSDVLTLTHMFPIWVGLLSWPMLGEIPSKGTWLALISGVAGAGLIQQPHFSDASFALFVALFCSIATAFAMLGLHQLHELDPRAVVCHFSGVSFFFCLGAMWLFGMKAPLEHLFEWPVQVALLGVGVFATVGQLFLTMAFAAGSPARVSVVGLSQILFALVFEVLFQGHSHNRWTLLGISLVVIPTAWITLSRRPAHGSRATSA